MVKGWLRTQRCPRCIVGGPAGESVSGVIPLGDWRLLLTAWPQAIDMPNNEHPIRP